MWVIGSLPVEPTGDVERPNATGPIFVLCRRRVARADVRCGCIATQTAAAPVNRSPSSSDPNFFRAEMAGAGGVRHQHSDERSSTARGCSGREAGPSRARRCLGQCAERARAAAIIRRQRATNIRSKEARAAASAPIQSCEEIDRARDPFGATSAIRLVWLQYLVANVTAVPVG
jgi:hypothetical protein